MPTASLIALAISIVGCVSDLRSRRIPNALTFGGALAGLLFHLVSGGARGAEIAALGWIAGCALFFIPFALGGLGGGDVKLVAALGAWLGPEATLWLALYTGAAGGVLAIAVALARGYLREALRNLWLLLAYWRVAGVRPLTEMTLAGGTGPRLAYGVAIMTGTMVTIWLH
jgi:prepilin peptidase CpaA